MPFQTLALDILHGWRVAEQLHAASTDPIERHHLQTEMRMRRRQYELVVRTALELGAPTPPRFPGTEEPGEL